jgi:hypothetical protein
VRELLRAGDFDQLIGVLEDATLETKRAPYRTEEDHQKAELAKDVSALANIAGGVLMLGPATHRDPSHLGDEIASVATYARNLVDPETYYAILRDWVYPAIDGLQVVWFPSRSDATRGVVAINVPPQPDHLKPFLITRSIEASGRRSEVLFGYCERQRANAVPLTVQQIHLRFRQAGDRDLRRGIDEMREQLAELQRARPFEAAPNPLTGEVIAARVDGARDSAGLAERATLTYASWPRDAAANVPGLFDANSVATRLLNPPPRLRDLGFNLGAHDQQSQIVAGERRRSLLQGYMVLELWRDGFLVFVAPADEDYLTWGRRDARPLRINPLVLAESAFLFVRLTKEVAQLLVPQPTELAIRVRLDFRPLDHRPQMVRGDLRGMGWQVGMNPEDAPGSVAELESIVPPAEEEGVIARTVVASVYHWFGIESEAVPFTENNAGRIAISPTRILEAGR